MPVRPLWRVALFSVVSGGFYQLYWLYRNWKEFRDHLNMDVNLKLRGLGLLVPFVNLYLVFKQLTEINELLEEDGLKPCRTKVLYPVARRQFTRVNTLRKLHGTRTEVRAGPVDACTV